MTGVKLALTLLALLAGAVYVSGQGAARPSCLLHLSSIPLHSCEHGNSDWRRPCLSASKLEHTAESPGTPSNRVLSGCDG